jgi:hypothetical protein
MILRGEWFPNYPFKILAFLICVIVVSLAGAFAYRRNFGITAAISVVGFPVVFGLMLCHRRFANREKPLPHIELPPARQTSD